MTEQHKSADICFSIQIHSEKESSRPKRDIKGENFDNIIDQLFGFYQKVDL